VSVVMLMVAWTLIESDGGIVSAPSLTDRVFIY